VAAAGIAAPVAATSLAAWCGGYPVVAAAGLALLAYPALEPLAPLEHPMRELRRFWQGYAAAWREKPLMRVILLANVRNGALACVGAFAAIRLTRELGMSDRAFGLLVTATGAVSLGAILAAGWCLDHVSLRRFHGVAGAIGASGAVLMGADDSVALTYAGCVVASSCGVLLAAPTSMWVSRGAGQASQGAAFSVQKVLMALSLSLCMLLLGLMERWFGMRLTLLAGGLCGVLAAGGFPSLTEPPRTSPFTPAADPREPGMAHGDTRDRTQ